MYAWENIVGRVAQLQHSDCFNQKVTSTKRIVVNAQALVVGEDHIDDQAGCHTDIEECTHSEKISPIIEKEKYITGGDICKPDKIGDNKQFAKRDQIVEMAVNLGQICAMRGGVVEPVEPRHINEEIYHH